MKEQNLSDRKFRRQVFLSAVWPYALLTVMLLMLFLAGIFYSGRILSRSADEMARKRLQELSETGYQNAVRYEKICDVLTSNNELLLAADVRANDQESLRQRGIALTRSLEYIHDIANVTVADLGVYFPKSGAYFSQTDKTLSRHQTQELFADSFGGSITVEALESIPKNHSWNISYAGEYGILVRAVQNRFGDAVAFILLQYRLHDLIPLDSGSGLVLIGQNDGMVYASDGGISQEDYQRLRAEIEENRSCGYGSETYIAKLSVFSLMRQDIIVAVPAGKATADMVSFTSVAVRLGVVCLLGLLLLYFIIYRRVIQPMHYLARASSHAGFSGTSRDVLRSAQNTLMALESQNKAIQDERAYLIPLGVGELMRRLCEVGEDSAPRFSARCLTLSGIGQTQRYFTVGLFHMDDENKVFLTMRNARSKVTPIFVLNNILADVLFNTRVGVVATVGHYYVVLCSCMDGEDGEAIRKILDGVIAFYKDTYQVTVAITEPQFGQGKDALRPAVKRTLNDLSYMDFWHKARTTEQERGEQRPVSSYFKAMRNLINRLDDQDYTGALEMFRHIMEDSLPMDREGLQVTRYRVYGMTEMLIAALAEQAGMDDSVLERLDGLYKLDGYDKFRNEVENLFMEIIEFQKEKDRTVTSAQRMDEVRSYIRMHYAENGLTAASIAENFGISNAYLSREFKKYTGCNVLEYIQKLRVEKAKSLLREESVKATAEKCGFWDVQALVRVFKKYEGITPGEYKKVLEKGEN